MDTPRQSEPGGRALLVVASLVVVVAGLKAASAILLPFMVSAFLAMMGLPLLFWLREKRVPTALAVLLIVIVILGVLGGVGFLVGGSANQFVDELPKYQERLDEMTRDRIEWLETQGIPVPDWRLELISPSTIVNLAQGMLQGVTAVLSNAFLVLITTSFILLEAVTLPAKLRRALAHRDGGGGRFSKVTREVQHYVAIKSAISLATGLLVAGWVAFLGVDFPLLWGLIAFVLNFIPAFGSVLAAVPAVLLATVQFGWGRAAVVAIGYVVVNVAFGNILEPHLMGRRLGLSPLVVLLSLLFWGWVWGPVGMLLSVPLTMIVKILLENTEDLRWIAVMLGPAVAEPPTPTTTSGEPSPQER